MSGITVSPDPFTLVPYDAAEIRALLEEAVALAGIAPTADVALTVDEELFAPLTGHMSDVADLGPGRAVDLRGQLRGQQAAVPLLEPTRPGSTSWSWPCAPTTRHIQGDFAEEAAAPERTKLSAVSEPPRDLRVRRRTCRPKLPDSTSARPRRHLANAWLRLRHFTDVADAAFDYFAGTPRRIHREGVHGRVAKETGASDRGPSKVPVDLLRQKVTAHRGVERQRPRARVKGRQEPSWPVTEDTRLRSRHRHMRYLPDRTENEPG